MSKSIENYLEMLVDHYSGHVRATTVLMEAEEKKREEQKYKEKLELIFTKYCEENKITEAIKLYEKLDRGEVDISYTEYLYEISLENEVVPLITIILDYLVTVSLERIQGGFVEEWCERALYVAEKSAGKKGIASLRSTISDSLAVI